MNKTITPETVTLWWTDSRRTGDLNMGEFVDAASARNAIPESLGELLCQCANGRERQEIRDGSFEIIRSID